jgi:O-antigen/teichoic acid export membrane protein/ubiquinone/menaquinone biosynthesis C-methylase UbiE
MFGVATGVVTLTLTTRLLGPEGRGQYAMVMTALALVLQFSNFGLHSSAVYHLSRQPKLREQVTGLLFWFSLVVVGLLAFLAYVLSSRIPTLLQSVPLSLLGIALFTAPPAMFLLLGSNAFLALGSATRFNALDLGTKLMGLVSVILLLWWPLSAVFVSYASLHYLLAACVFIGLIGFRSPMFPTLSLVMNVFGYGVRAFLAAFFMFLVLRADLFLVNSLLSTADAGQYSVAVQVAEILTLAAASVGVILFPRLSAMEPTQRWQSAKQMTKITAILLGIVTVILAIMSQHIFVAWFGIAFLPAVGALLWLLPGLWCLGVNTILYQHLAASGMPWFVVGATFVGASVNILLNLRFIPIFGIAGAAGTSSLSYAALLVLSVWYLRRQFPHGVKDERKFEEYQVLTAYDRYSTRMVRKGNRSNPVYVASKALCDWAPLYDVDMKNAHVLNIGCGEPIDELYFSEHVGSWTSIDINPRIVDGARNIFLSLASPVISRKVRFAVTDARCLAFPAATFDMVVSYSTIEHIPGEEGRQDAYGEIRRVLKLGGIAVITVPNRFSSFRFTHKRNVSAGVLDYGYAHLYSVREFRQCLERAKLVPVRFTADLLGAISLLSYCPPWLYQVFRPIGYLSDRIGYVCRAK